MALRAGHVLAELMREGGQDKPLARSASPWLLGRLGSGLGVLGHVGSSFQEHRPWGK